MASDPAPQQAVRLSNRQYTLLKYLDAARAGFNLEEMSHLNQLTIGANKRRGWLTENKTKDGIVLTPEGRKALHSFDNAMIERQVARMKFSSFLNLDVYDQQKEKVRRKRRKLTNDKLQIVHRGDNNQTSISA